MLFTKASILALAATLVESTTTLGKARVVNNCDFAVTAWSVGSDVGPATTLSAHGGAYAETFSRDPKTGGRAIKITVQPDGLYTGKAQTIFAQSLQDNAVWYDMSDVFGDAFAGHKAVVSSANAACPQIVWENGVPPAGSQVKVCDADHDVTLTLCSA
ncbi:Antigenic thaumatin-like protein [Cladobotryum mycophilum]|uniref:Antigenic thaumatin-like protein n=1 Tax=Cladobotryum mycophilum TaxID=491253 RepID=A0ABR0T575_9HYPO